MIRDYTKDLNKLTVGFRNCRLAFNNSPAEFTLLKCSFEWGQLKETNESDIRHCSQCNTAVHFCYDDEDIVRNIRVNNCIAFLDSTKTEMPEILMGAPTMSDRNNKPLTE